MSPEAWAFFSANSLALLALIGKAIDSYFKNRKADAKQNVIIDQTKSVANGAIPSMRDDISFIRDVVTSLDKRVERLEEIVK